VLFFFKGVDQKATVTNNQKNYEMLTFFDMFYPGLGLTDFRFISWS